MDRRTLLVSASAGLAGLGMVRLANAMEPKSYRIPALGINPTQISYFTPSPFIDRLKASSGQWSAQGVSTPLPLNEAGYPTSMGGAGIVLIMVSLDPVSNGAPKNYELTYDGDATFELQFAQIVSSRRGKIVFRFAGPNMAVGLIYRSIGRQPPTKITLVRQDHAALFAAGEIFTPEFLQQVSGFDTLRFMDWLAANGNTLTDSFRPVSSLTYASGVPLEIVIALANKTGASPWVTIPHLATDAFVKDIIAKLKSGLRPGIVPTLEYSNEVWNLGFPQARYATEQASQRWGAGTSGQVFYGYRSGEIAKLARGSGVRVALGCQTMVPARAADVWRGVELSGATNRDFSDWIIATYVNGTLTQKPGPTDQLMASNDIAGAIDNIVNSADPKASSVRTMRPIYAAHGAIAASHGLRLTAYEGNLHLNAVPYYASELARAVAFFDAIEKDPGSVAILQANLDAFAAAGGKLACLYNLSSAASGFGNFGLVDKPAWTFIRQHLGQQPASARP